LRHCREPASPSRGEELGLLALLRSLGAVVVCKFRFDNDRAHRESAALSGASMSPMRSDASSTACGS
jgi:hypothetical protein